MRIPRLTQAGQTRLALCFPAATRTGAQDHGETTWLRWWRGSMGRLGIRIDSVPRARMPSDELCFALALKHECWPELVIRNESVAEIMALARRAP